MIIKFISQAFAALKNLFSHHLKIKRVEDEPNLIASKKLYIIGEDNFPAFAIMLCPCGCKNKIYLNLISGDKPTWSISESRGIPTITPSIWRKVGCKSHFFVHSGKIFWAKS